MNAGPWRRLGIDATRDVRAIKRAYAKALKAIDPETDPAAFIALREARDHALAWARLPEGQGVAEPEKVVAADAGITFNEEEAVRALDIPRRPSPWELTAAEPPPPDEALIAATRGLHAIFFDPAADASPEAIGAQIEHILALLASGPIDQQRDFEPVLIELLVQGSPLSDPMLDPLATYFAWDDDSYDRHAGFTNWIAQRRSDRLFEFTLAGNNPRLARLLTMLQSPTLEPPAAWKRWWDGPRVEYLLDYLEAHHPTTFAALNQGTVSEWRATCARQHRAPAPIRWLHEGRLKTLSDASTQQEVSTRDHFWLVVLILVVPWFFAWFLLRPGYSRTARALGFGYLAIILILAVAGDPSRDRVPQGGYEERSEMHFRSQRQDIEWLLRAYMPGNVTVAELSQRNPSLLAQLRVDWGFARERKDWDGLVETAGRRFDDVLRAALHGRDETLIREHAQAYAKELSWQAHTAPEVCDAMISGKMPEVTKIYGDARRRLTAKVVLSGTEAEGTGERGRVTDVRIPGAMMRDAIDRTGIPADEFKAALAGGGTARQRCNARIALIETALSSDAGLPVLRKLF